MKKKNSEPAWTIAQGQGLGQGMVIFPAAAFPLLGGFSNIGSMCGLSNISGLGGEEYHQLTDSMTCLLHPLIYHLIHVPTIFMSLSYTL